jgi:hypothetical protein
MNRRENNKVFFKACDIDVLLASCNLRALQRGAASTIPDNCFVGFIVMYAGFPAYISPYDACGIRCLHLTISGNCVVHYEDS